MALAILRLPIRRAAGDQIDEASTDIDGPCITAKLDRFFIASATKVCRWSSLRFW
jgi:hypothetical protein